MPQHDQKTAKNHYCGWYKHSNNKYCWDRLIFRKLFKNYQNKNYEMKNR